MPDAYDCLTDKVQGIFDELVGARAETLRGDTNAALANDILGRALTHNRSHKDADELAFHFVDWNADAAFVVAFLLYPERFSAEELRAAVDLFLCHVPAHVLAAARLGGYDAKDIFADGDAI